MCSVLRLVRIVQFACGVSVAFAGDVVATLFRHEECWIIEPLSAGDISRSFLNNRRRGAERDLDNPRRGIPPKFDHFSSGKVCQNRRFHIRIKLFEKLFKIYKFVFHNL